MSEENICEECGGNMIYSNYEYICSACGLVNERNERIDRSVAGNILTYRPKTIHYKSECIIKMNWYYNPLTGKNYTFVDRKRLHSASVYIYDELLSLFNIKRRSIYDYDFMYIFQKVNHIVRIRRCVYLCFYIMLKRNTDYTDSYIDSITSEYSTHFRIKNMRKLIRKYNLSYLLPKKKEIDTQQHEYSLDLLDSLNIPENRYIDRDTMIKKLKDRSERIIKWLKQRTGYRTSNIIVCSVYIAYCSIKNDYNIVGHLITRHELCSLFGREYNTFNTAIQTIRNTLERFGNKRGIFYGKRCVSSIKTSN